MKSRNFIHYRPSKYKNKTCFVDGIRFDSRREADYYGQLKIEKRAGLVKDFKRQVEFDLAAWTPIPCGGAAHLLTRNCEKVCSHKVDFLVTLNDGSQEVREVKGFETDIWHLKRKLFEANYPSIKYRVVR